MPPTLPDNITWAAFKKSRHGFRPGACDQCKQNTDKLYARGHRFLCSGCWWWIEDAQQKEAA